MDEIERAADSRVKKSFTISFSSGLVEHVKESAIRISTTPTGNIGTESGDNVPDRDVRLVFLKQAYNRGNIFRVWGILILKKDS